MLGKIAQKYAEIASVFHNLVERAHRVRGAAPEQSCCRILQHGGGHRSERVQHVLFGHAVSRVGQALIRQRQRVAHAAVRRAGDQPESVRLDVRPRLLQNRGEIRHDMRDRQTVEIEALTARNDGRGELLRFGRRKDEENVFRRLLKRFQKRVERRVREHVHLVDDEHAILQLQRRELRLVDQGTDVVHAVVRRGVDLDHVRAARLCKPACGAGSAGFPVLRVETVDRARKDLCRARLSRPARTAEQIGVGELSVPHLVFQYGRDMVLSDDLPEGFGAVLAIQCASCQSVASFPKRQTSPHTLSECIIAHSFPFHNA